MTPAAVPAAAGPTAAVPAVRASPAHAAVPVGLRVLLDPDVRRLDGDRVLLGGDPGRLLRLTRGGLLERLAGGDPSLRALARTLLDGGLAHPRPHPAPELVGDVCVVVPVRDRVPELTRCLAALGTSAPVLVVDDGSTDPEAVAAACRAAGARVLHLPINGGPGAARDVGLRATTAPLVALVDSDCVPPPGWLPALLGHFADPAVAAVAPRVRSRQAPRAAATLLARYAGARGPLDMGPHEGRVRPGARVPYVPTAALVLRRSALAAGDAFDPALRHGEDVDLVWRLHDAGWQVRYDPRTHVVHDEPARWRDWLVRRHRYGTSAAPLSARHGARLAPLVLPPLPSATWLLLLAGHPLPAALAAAVPLGRLRGRLRAAGLSPQVALGEAAGAVVRGVVGTAGGLGGAGTVTTGPVLVALLGPRRTRRGAAVALAVPPLLEWATRRPDVDPGTWTVLRLLDDLAYASGVWRGCLAARTALPLRPRLVRPV